MSNIVRRTESNGVVTVELILSQEQRTVLQYVVHEHRGNWNSMLPKLSAFLPAEIFNECGQVISATSEYSAMLDAIKLELSYYSKIPDPIPRWDPQPWYEKPPWSKPTEDEPPINPISEEDTNMGFGKGRKFPADIKELDYSMLANSQMWVMSDFVGCRSKLNSLNGRKVEQLAALKAACEANLQRAQFGYDLIVLLKDPPKGEAIPKDLEAHYVELLCDILNKYSQGLEESSRSAVDKIMTGLQARLKEQESDLRELAKKAVIEAAEKRAPIIIKDGEVKRKVKGVLPPEFKTMVELASARIPIMLVGPAGCGKTYLAGKLAEAMGMEYSDQSCSEGMSESVFNGRLLPIGKNGEFKHVATPFMQRYEHGGVMLLDEIDAGDPNLFTYINKAIANTAYTVEQRHTNPVVKKHADFVLVVAANTFGNGADAMYVGRNQLDAATLDRFRVGLLPLDYNREVEESLAPRSVCEWGWEIRDKINKQKVRRIMSTRVIEQMGIMTTRYKWERPQWDKVYFAGWTEAERKLVA